MQGCYQIFKEKNTNIHVDGVGNFEYKNQGYLAGVDITPAITDNIKLVAGAYSGLSVLKFNAKGNISGNTISESDSINGLIVGGKLGAILANIVNDKTEIEFGVKGDYTDYKPHNAKNENVATYVSLTAKF